eukprot:COSAG05_NODE_417_length_10026_cov_189.415634_1_plen_505_part_00
MTPCKRDGHHLLHFRHALIDACHVPRRPRCRCLIHLFSNFPASKDLEVKRVEECKRLAREFQQYVMRTRRLRKVFVSIKGIYYQADIATLPVTWVVPHAFSQTVPTDVDYRVMVTFLEFACCQLRFINFKLYHDADFAYPPKLDDAADEGRLGLAAVHLEKAAPKPAIANAPGDGRKAKAIELDSTITAKLAALDEDGTDESEAMVLAGKAALEQLAEDDGEEIGGQGGLFKDVVIFLNREVNVECMLFILHSCGAKTDAVGWDGSGSPFAKDNAAITHEIVDRPLREDQKGAKTQLSRLYIQPQWVFDSINAMLLLPCHEYEAGQKLPPHLSPFVDNAKQGYVPRRQKELDAYKEGKSLDQIEWSDEEDAEKEEEVDEDADDGDEEEVARRMSAAGKRKRSQEEEGQEEEEEEGGEEEKLAAEEDEDDQEDADEDQEQLKAADSDEDEDNMAQKEKELAIMAMTKKNYRLYQRMQHGIAKKSEEAEVLKSKRRKLKKESKKSS